jgi:hypothetical protein
MWYFIRIVTEATNLVEQAFLIFRQLLLSRYQFYPKESHCIFPLCPAHCKLPTHICAHYVCICSSHKQDAKDDINNIPKTG